MLTFALAIGFLVHRESEKGKGRVQLLMELRLTAMGCHLPYGITQCYLPPDTSDRAPPNPSHAGWYSIYLLEGWKAELTFNSGQVDLHFAVLNRVSSHFLIPLSDSSLICTVPAQ